MATSKTIEINVTLPEVLDIADSPYSRFASEIGGVANPIFHAIATPENAIRCIAVTDGASLPAIAALTETIKRAYDGLPQNTPLTFDRAKQLAGVIVCRLMELNGFKRRAVNDACRIRFQRRRGVST